MYFMLTWQTRRLLDPQHQREQGKRVDEGKSGLDREIASQ
jgi:hypothetical protein